MIEQLKLTWLTSAMLSATMLAACSGGTEGTGENGNNKTGIHGIVKAPAGTIAFAEPAPWWNLIDALLGKSANATIDGVAPVAAGVEVDLIQVDANGNQVGEVIASSQTKAGGNYNIAINNFQAGSQYLVRAIANSQTMDARVTNSSVDVNPITDAASQLIASKVADLGELDVSEVEQIVDSVNDISKNVDPSGLSAQSLSAAIQQEALNEDDSSNVINSSTSLGRICGKVLSPSSKPLANIQIIARDFGNWVTRAKSKTKSDGSYCVNVPIKGDPDPDSGGLFSGEYILGAISHSDDLKDPERSASEWWTQSGVGESQFVAEKILIQDSGLVERNFNLARGGRISGKVSGASFGAAIEGITIVIRNFESLAPVASARSDENGGFSVNLAAGAYFVEARNSTLQPYASEVYDGNSGSNNMNHAIPVTVANGQVQSINFALGSGYLLSGIISDGIGGAPVTGRRVMVNLTSGGGSVRVRSNKVGRYNVWLMAGTYNIYAYGQQKSSFILPGNSSADFSSDTVSTINATILHNNIGVSQAKVRLYDANGGYINQEPSNSDGSVSFYTDSIGDHLLEVRVDQSASYGSSIYKNQTRLLSGQPIAVLNSASTLSVGNIDLPDAGVLKGKVTGNAGSPAANVAVQVWSGTSNLDRFIIVRSRGDGSYAISLPANTYGRINFANASASANDGCNSITITAGTTTTLNYDLVNASCSQP